MDHLGCQLPLTCSRGASDQSLGSTAGTAHPQCPSEPSAVQACSPPGTKAGHLQGATEATQSSHTLANGVGDGVAA